MKRRQRFYSRIGTVLLQMTDFARSRLSRESVGKWGSRIYRPFALLMTAITLPLTGFAESRPSEFLANEAARAGGAPQGGLLYFVDTTSDTVVPGACANGNPGCSLRGAIQAANSHVGSDGIEISLPSGSVINLTDALPDLTESVTITGPGANLVTVRRDTGGNYRIFNVFATGTVTLSGMTLSNGLSSNGGAIANGTGTVNIINCTLIGNAVSSPGDGGGISNYTTGTVNVTGSLLRENSSSRGGGISNSSTGTVTIINSNVFENIATASGAESAFGGGIFNSGTLNVTNSFIGGNKAITPNTASSFNSAGGGVYNSAGTVTITTSTVAYNGASPFSSGSVSTNASGGGVFNDTGTVSVINSTIADNSALADGNTRSARGGGIFNNSGAVNVINSTIGGNSSINGSAALRFGGGIFNATGAVRVRSTIIASNSVFMGGANPDASGPFISDGFNLIGARDGSTGFTQPTDQTGTAVSPLDPMFEPGGLQFNGGATPTSGLRFGSPAIDKGTGEVQPGLFLITDQRGPGFPRTFDDPATPNATGGDGADIGAFELQTARPTTLANISTRLRVETGDNVLIGGFIVTGTQPKRIIVRAIGPSLPVGGVLADPVLELRNSSGVLMFANDNWRSDQEAEIIATTIPPSNDLEAAIVATLPANISAYTAIVRGVNNGTGIGVVEAYDLDGTVDSKLANISTRGLVQTGDNVLIGGLIVLGQDSLGVIVRAIGPSLSVSGKLPDPTLELRDGNGGLVASNDNWRSDQEAEIVATNVPPTNDLESAIVRDLAPGNYTAIVSGLNNATGVGLVEAYALN